MRILLSLASVPFLVLALSSPAQSSVPELFAESYDEQHIIQHGGGCRKSSPPGQCCHLETRTGKVHCY